MKVEKSETGINLDCRAFPHLFPCDNDNDLAYFIFHSAPSGLARLLSICCHCEAQGRPQYSIVMLHTLENSNRFTNFSKPDYTIIDQ